MSDTSATTQTSPRGDVHENSASTAREDAGRELAHALDEERWAHYRAHVRTPVVGLHGENFDKRNARVEHTVAKFHAKRVSRARKNALRTGWTKEQLTAAGLDGAHKAK